MAEEETWEIDPLDMCLDDFIVLAKGFGKGGDPQAVKETLGRVVSNKTAEEIGQLPLRDLNKALDAAMAALREAAIPKANATP